MITKLLLYCTKSKPYLYSMNRVFDGKRLFDIVEGNKEMVEEKIFYKKVQEMFKGDYIDKSHVDVDFIECIDEIIIGVREDIRYYSGEEMLQALEKFFIYLRQNDIDVEDGYLEWEDEYEPDYIYCWRSSRVTDDVEILWSFYKLDRQTNRILWYKQYKQPVKISKNGKELIDYESKDYVIKESEKDSKYDK